MVFLLFLLCQRTEDLFFCDCHEAYQSVRHNEGRVSGMSPVLNVLKALRCQNTLAFCSGLIGTGIVRTGLIFCHSATYTILITIATAVFPILMSQWEPQPRRCWIMLICCWNGWMELWWVCLCKIRDTLFSTRGEKTIVNISLQFVGCDMRNW